MRIVFLYLWLFLSLSCTTTSNNSPTHTAVFNASYDIVWQAALLALKTYPIKSENLEAGQIETQVIRGYTSWTPPAGFIRNLKNRYYKIKIFLEKGAISRKENAVKIHLIKEEFINKDFIQQNIPVTSNGLEEEIILYRIHREILLQKEKKLFHERKRQLEKEKEESLSD